MSSLWICHFANITIWIPSKRLQIKTKSSFKLDLELLSKINQHLPRKMPHICYILPIYYWCCLLLSKSYICHSQVGSMPMLCQFANASDHITWLISWFLQVLEIETIIHYGLLINNHIFDKWNSKRCLPLTATKNSVKFIKAISINSNLSKTRKFKLIFRMYIQTESENPDWRRWMPIQRK